MRNEKKNTENLMVIHANSRREIKKRVHQQDPPSNVLTERPEESYERKRRGERGCFRSWV